MPQGRAIKICDSLISCAALRSGASFVEPNRTLVHSLSQCYAWLGWSGEKRRPFADTR